MTRTDKKELASAARAYRAQGIEALRKGDRDKAMDDFSEAIRLNPRDAEAYLLRSTVHLVNGTVTLGCEDWDSAVLLNPGLTELKPKKVEDYSFEQRPLSELPKDGRVIEWLGDDNDDQWEVSDEDGTVAAAVVNGGDFTVWSDEPLTDAFKRESVADFEETMARGEFEEVIYDKLAEWGLDDSIFRPLD
jgi:hypothetical protein